MYFLENIKLTIAQWIVYSRRNLPGSITFIEEVKYSFSISRAIFNWNDQQILVSDLVDFYDFKIIFFVY